MMNLLYFSIFRLNYFIINRTISFKISLLFGNNIVMKSINKIEQKTERIRVPKNYFGPPT